MASHSPYNYGLNNPVYFNDPFGDYVEPTLSQEHVGPSFNDLFGEGVRAWRICVVVSGIFGGPPIPDGGGYSSSMSIHEFYNSAMSSRYGGSWTNGRAHFFESDDEAFAADVAYNFKHNSWGNTYYGSYERTLVGYIALRSTGLLLWQWQFRRQLVDTERVR